MRKQENQFSKQEAYVYNLINERKPLQFFPVERAMCLDTEAEEMESNTRLFQKVSDLEAKLNLNNNKLSQLAVLLAASMEQIRSFKSKANQAAGPVPVKPPLSKKYSMMGLDLTKVADTVKRPLTMSSRK